jgi:methyl-accepting chemotaxis protein
MKTAVLAIVMCATLFVVVPPARAADNDNENQAGVITPDDMETVKQADVSVMMPKGGQLQKQSSFTIMEGADEYASRRLQETDARIEKLERRIDEQQKQLEDLKRTVADMNQQAQARKPSAQENASEPPATR